MSYPPQERLYHVYPELAYFGPARSGEVVGLKEAEKTTPVTPAPSTLRDQSLCQEDPVTHERETEGEQGDFSG